MGGNFALALATLERGLKAGVPYYGAPPTDPAALARIKAPILGNYGGDDKGPSPGQVKAFEDAPKKAGRTVDIKIYPRPPPPLPNPQKPRKGYLEEAAQDTRAPT